MGGEGVELDEAEGLENTRARERKELDESLLGIGALSPEEFDGLAISTLAECRWRRGGDWSVELGALGEEGVEVPEVGVGARRE